MSDAKSQKLSCAVCACGKPRSGSCFAAWIRSGNLIASWMKKTGMLFPTMSQLPSTRVQLHREAPHVAGQVGRALVAGDGREADERGRAQARLRERVGRGDVRQRLVALEVPVRTEPPGVHHALGDALVVEVEDLLPEVGVLERRRAPLADPERVLVVADRDALLRGQRVVLVAGGLVGVATGTTLDGLLAVRDLRAATRRSRCSHEVSFRRSGRSPGWSTARDDPEGRTRYPHRSTANPPRTGDCVRAAPAA